MIYEAEIIDIKPNAMDGDKIVDSFVKVKVNGIEFWTFVYEWRSKSWSLSFIGKRKSLRFVLLEGALEACEEEKKIVPVKNSGKPCDYKITGEIKNVSPHPSFPEKEKIEVDFGITVEFTEIQNKGVFKVGQYVRAEGRLDAHLVKRDDEK